VTVLLGLKPDLRAQIAHATAIAAKLHAATEALNEQLAAFERQIVALNLGVSATVEGVTFGKRGGTWGLFVEVRGEATPILHASREMRIKSIATLPMLIESLFGETERQLTDVQDGEGLRAASRPQLRHAHLAGPDRRRARGGAPMSERVRFRSPHFAFRAGRKFPRGRSTNFNTLSVTPPRHG
jgi:hypothetical protein